MNENDLEEDFLEKLLDSGEMITLYQVPYGFDVDCWDEDGNDKWNVVFSDYKEAKAEYDRWN